MSSMKCPHCGLVNFSTEGICKRCKKDLAATTDFASRYQSPTQARESSFRFQSDYPLVSWAITFVLLISSASLAYAISRKSTTNSYEALGATIGGILAWPIILLIVYGLSKKFRKKYSLHAVINYGLGVNTIIQSFMLSR